MALSLHQRKKFLFEKLRQDRGPSIQENLRGSAPSGRWIGRGDIRVECRQDGTEGDTPARFHLGREPLDIVEVKESWLSPEHCYFKVGTEDGAEYILRHDRRYDLWEVTTFAAIDVDVPSTD